MFWQGMRTSCNEREDVTDARRQARNRHAHRVETHHSRAAGDSASMELRHESVEEPQQRGLAASGTARDEGQPGPDLHVHIARLRRKLAEHGGNNLIRGDGSAGYTLALVVDHENNVLKTIL